MPYDDIGITCTVIFGLGLTGSTEVVLAGVSAGGVGVVLRIDDVRKTLPSSTIVRGLVQSSFFFSQGTGAPAVFTKAMQFVYTEMKRQCVVCLP